jgi:predicted metal-dependent phosphoesterase TrpH
MSESPPAGLFKADLHCHTRHSGHAKHLRFLRCRDCYSTPLDVYKTAKRRGMDLVTITDHDSIGGGLELLDRLGDLPDFIMGEEASVFFPQFQHEVHVAVYGLNEGHHREIQRLRSNGEELVAYLRQQKLLFVLNHFFHDFADGARVREFILRMAQLFDVFEVRNGSQLREHNLFIVKLLQQYGEGLGGGRPFGMIGGSDAHTLRRIGRTYTASPARTKKEFLDDIRSGRTQVFGRHSDHLSLAADIYGVVLRHFPAVFSGANGNFPPAVRAKAAVLTLMTTPFLFTPYLVAVRHSRIERERINLFSRLLLGPQALPLTR